MLKRPAYSQKSNALNSSPLPIPQRFREFEETGEETNTGGLLRVCIHKGGGGGGG